MEKLNIGIIYGGQSTEHEVSLRSAQSVLDALDKSRYTVSLIYISKKGEWLLADQSESIEVLEDGKDSVRLSILPSRQFISERGEHALDAVLPILHGTAGEDGIVQGVLQMMNIPYAGCNVRSSAVCMDKDMTKRLLKMEGIHVADWVLCRHSEKEEIDYGLVESELGLPMFIKPVNQGSSVGVSKVTDARTFQEALDLAFQFDTKVMIESAVRGREIEVSVLGNADPFVSVPGEIVANTDFYSYESKYIDENGAALEIPASLDDDTRTRIQKTAVDAYRILDCEGMSRVDVFLREDGEIIVNEINTLPGFTSISMYPKLLEASGISYAELLDRLIALSLERHELQSSLKTDLS
ncbi:D-alanine--D-alanine ligase [Salinicoccus sp. ID82-1]|uniref:D-alanine--D-alanine ligase n=1 Tax=Salinicoccus sp. ID82-1 TaxID=2820269 RepID=UPI001F029B75|nr:D-alanine--D-alanine ligase [Salinicoccus sp. ID82-1]MCG1010672.1 D-alanine--D-alanine ligase [Salinicoccus sp. ID82-1]